jgi:cellobiose phosphorylase
LRLRQARNSRATRYGTRSGLQGTFATLLAVDIWPKMAHQAVVDAARH